MRPAQVRNNFLFIFWFTFFFVSILRQPTPSSDPNNYQRVRDRDNTVFEEQSSVSKELFPVDVKDTVKSASVIHVSGAPALNRDEESFRMGVIEAIGGLKLEEVAASLQIPATIQKPQVVKKIFLVTTWRTGSTFLGELIHSSPGVFYSYEPVHFLQYHLPKPPTKPMELIRSIFGCRFTADYLRHVSKRENGGQDFLIMNRRVWQSCRHDSSLCLRPDFVRQLCVHFPVRMIKEVRLTLDEIVNDGLMDDDDDANSTNDVNSSAKEEWKVVYLARDPRAIMASRANITWCMEDEACGNAEHLCRDMEEDLSRLETLRAKRPDRYYLLKYEEFNANLEVETKRLFDFLGLEVSAPVRVFLDTHTLKTEAEWDPHSIHRDSKKAVTAWRDKLSKENATEISETCSSVLEALDYPPL